MGVTNFSGGFLWHSTGHAGGMTPLLDREGKPIITTLLEEKE